jgi:hypothetical protein
MAKLFGSRRRAELTVRADQCPAKALSFGKILNNHPKSVSWHSDRRRFFNRNEQHYTCCSSGGGRSCLPRRYFIRA